MSADLWASIQRDALANFGPLLNLWLQILLALSVGIGLLVLALLIARIGLDRM